MRVCIIRVVVGVCERLRRGVYPTPLAVHLARVGNQNSFRGQSDCRFQPLTTHILPLTRIWFNTKFTRRTVSLFLHNWHFSFITAKQCFFKTCLSVFFVCQCLSRQIVCSTTQSWFSSEKRWVGIISIECLAFCSTSFVTQFPWQHFQTDSVF